MTSNVFSLAVKIHILCVGSFLGLTHYILLNLKEDVYSGHICAGYWLSTLEFTMEMYTKWGTNNTMDYDWLGVQSEQHLTMVLIETRLTRDILLDEIVETGKRRDEGLVIQQLRKGFLKHFHEIIKTF